MATLRYACGIEACMDERGILRRSGQWRHACSILSMPDLTEPTDVSGIVWGRPCHKTVRVLLVNCMYDEKDVQLTLGDGVCCWF
jgi:hypothetical protein